MRTETLAIVFTDIKGYTAATSAQTHQENAQMLRRIERLIAPVVAGYSGRVIKSIGDAYMIVFRSPTEAVRCATAIQDRLHQHNTSSSADQAIHIRIAMNIGEVRVHRGDVFGEPVNIAARVEAVTPADEIYFSEAIFLTMNRTDLPCEQVGEFELKGIPHPVTVFRVKKFAHVGEGEKVEDATKNAAQGLPFGGRQLGHWKRMRWVRRAYLASWALAVVGLVGAAYLRYRPAADYTELVAEIKNAVEQGKPIDALARAGQIPESAVQERASARRFRRIAVEQLLRAGDLDTAGTELTSLLTEDPRDADALVLQATLLARRGKDMKAALAAVGAAYKLNPSVADREDVAAIVAQGYLEGGSRRLAEDLVENALKQRAVAPLTRLLSEPTLDKNARRVIAQRLEKLGAGQEIDWVALALEDLKSTNCKTKKDAIARLTAEGDERAVGPLMKLAETKGCGAPQAQKAAEAILGK